jgi:uncharacterized protein (DUF2267 family)
MEAKLVRRPAGLAALAVVGMALAGRRGRRLARAMASRMERRARYLPGAMRGMRYRMSGRHPDPNVFDDVLADRIRSQLGGLERRLDIPRVHVMARDHVVSLHGDVPSATEATAVEQAVAKVPGVRGVESFLHIGLTPGDTRPSEGRAHAPPSEAMRALVAAAGVAGGTEDAARAAARGVLSALAERLPEHDREQLFAHLPADVVAMARPPRRTGRADRARRIEDFLGRVAEAGAVDPSRVSEVTESVLGALRRLVPEEAPDVAAVLPAELQRFWETAVPYGASR